MKGEGKLAALNGLAGNYSAALQPETARMLLYLLRGYSEQQVQEAALDVICEYGPESVPYRSMPPFSLMQKALDRIAGNVGAAERDAAMAEAEWAQVLRAAREVGSWGSPSLGAATEFVLRQMGGWRCACAWREQDLPWRRREFIELWKMAKGKVEYLEKGADGVAALGALRTGIGAPGAGREGAEQAGPPAVRGEAALPEKG